MLMAPGWVDAGCGRTCKRGYIVGQFDAAAPRRVKIAVHRAVACVSTMARRGGAYRRCLGRDEVDDAARLLC